MQKPWVLYVCVYIAVSVCKQCVYNLYFLCSGYSRFGRECERVGGQARTAGGLLWLCESPHVCWTVYVCVHRCEWGGGGNIKIFGQKSDQRNNRPCFMNLFAVSVFAWPGELRSKPFHGMLMNPLVFVQCWVVWQTCWTTSHTHEPHPLLTSCLCDSKTEFTVGSH